MTGGAGSGHDVPQSRWLLQKPATAEDGRALWFFKDSQVCLPAWSGWPWCTAAPCDSVGDRICAPWDFVTRLDVDAADRRTWLLQGQIRGPTSLDKLRSWLLGDCRPAS